MNCALFEADGRYIMFECGVTFPESHHYGIDVIIPDFEIIDEIINRVDALVVTHGHMDHIGAVPWFCEMYDVPVYAPRFAAALIRRSLAERGLEDDVDLIEYDEHSHIELKTFDLSFVPVTHSVPDTFAVRIDTEVGTFLHTADFKIDDRPLLGPAFDAEPFRAIGAEGVRALFSDSTNSQVPGRTRSESDAMEALAEVVSEAEGRVLVGMFSSNLHRVQALLNIGVETGRHVAFMGRSLRNAVRIARDMGLLRVGRNDLIVDTSEMDDYPNDRIIACCTGTQGEPRAALSRLAFDEFPHAKLKDDDTIVFSARIIPGNEQYRFRIYDQLSRRGMRVITPVTHPVHCSGHAKADELREMLSFVQPAELVPVHGDHRFLTEHARLGAEAGARAHVLENGEMLEFTAEHTRRIAEIETARILVDGSPLSAFDGEAFRQRRQLARSGSVTVSVVISRRSGKILAKPIVLHRGVLEEDEDGREILADARHAASDAIRALNRTARTDSALCAEAIRVALRRLFKNETGRKPVIDAVVHIV